MTPMTGGQGFGSTGKPRDIGNGYKSVTSQQFTPEQMNLFSQMFGQVSPDSYLSKLAGGDQSQFAQMEAPAMRQFGEQQAGLASRFAGMGGTGALRSSGAQNVMTSASQNLAAQLQSNRQNLMRQAQQDLFGMSRDLLGQRPYSEYLLEPQAEEPSFWEKLLGGLSGGAGTALGMFGGQAAGKGLSSLGGMFGGKKTGYQGNNADRIY